MFVTPCSGLFAFPLLRLRDEVVHVDCPPLAVADDHLRRAVIVHIGNFNRTDVLRRVDRPAWQLRGHIVGVNILPRLGYNQLLVTGARQRRQL